MNQFQHTPDTKQAPLKQVHVQIDLLLHLEQPVEDWLADMLEKEIDIPSGERLLDWHVEEVEEQ